MADHQQLIRAPEHDEEVLVATALLHALQGEYVERVEETGTTTANIMTVMNTDGVQVWQHPGNVPLPSKTFARMKMVILACNYLFSQSTFQNVENYT